MKRAVLALVLVGVLVGGVSLVYAQDRPAQPADQTPRAFGQVKSVDAEKGTVTVTARAGRDAEPKDMTFVVTKDTKITQGEEAKTLADLKAGTTVVVTYEKAAEGVNPTAKTISIRVRRPAADGG